MPGLPEKLTVLPLSLFMFGWVLYTAGFAWALISNYRDWGASRKDPTSFPLYLTLVGGPFVAVLGLLHAIRSSSIFGAFSAVLSNIYFVSAGFVALYSSMMIHSQQMENTVTDYRMVLMFTGSLIEGLCWCLVLILSMFYKYPHQRQERHHNPRPLGPRRPFTPGKARILSIPCVFLSFIGWCVLIAGVAYEYGYFFYQSAIFFIPFFLYLAALLHAGCLGGASTVMGVFASILSVLYFYFMGYQVIIAAVQLYGCNKDKANFPPDDICDAELSFTLELGGGIVSLIFLGCILVLWPFYRKHPKVCVGENTSEYQHDTPPYYGAVQHSNNYIETQPLVGNNSGSTE